jgi:hypothetical protein
LFWNCWNSATRMWYTGWDSGSWSVIWSIHLISMLV